MKEDKGQGHDATTGYLVIMHHDLDLAGIQLVGLVCSYLLPRRDVEHLKPKLTRLDISTLLSQVL